MTSVIPLLLGIFQLKIIKTVYIFGTLQSWQPPHSEAYSDNDQSMVQPCRVIIT